MKFFSIPAVVLALLAGCEGGPDPVKRAEFRGHIRDLMATAQSRTPHDVKRYKDDLGAEGLADVTEITYLDDRRRLLQITVHSTFDETTVVLGSEWGGRIGMGNKPCNPDALYVYEGCEFITPKEQRMLRERILALHKNLFKSG